jgi:hypothetical protein
MKAWRAGGRAWGLLLLPVLTAIALLAPAQAAALDSDLKGSAIFRLEASNGYSILGFAASERADGRGDMGLIVSDKRGGVLYAVPAVVTPTRLEADLGSLGRISLEIAPSGFKRTLKSRCGEDPVTFEPNVYRGTFEFRGEEGYTGASATTLREYARFWLDFGCGGVSFGETRGATLPGARLTLDRGRGHDRLRLQVNKNRPGARTRLEIEVHEKRRRIEISRSATLWAGAGAFRYDPLLQTATLAPPAPFSGQATFHHGAPPAGLWAGNLTVDLPGRSNVSLTGSGARATLVPSCWHEGEDRFRC